MVYFWCVCGSVKSLSDLNHKHLPCNFRKHVCLSKDSSRHLRCLMASARPPSADAKGHKSSSGTVSSLPAFCGCLGYPCASLTASNTCVSTTKLSFWSNSFPEAPALIGNESKCARNSPLCRFLRSDWSPCKLLLCTATIFPNMSPHFY